MKPSIASLVLLCVLVVVLVQEASATHHKQKKHGKGKWAFQQPYPNPSCCQAPACNACQQAPVYRPSPKPVYRPPVCNVCQQQQQRPVYRPPRPKPRPVVSCDPCANSGGGGYGGYQSGGYGGGPPANIPGYGRKRREAVLGQPESASNSTVAIMNK